MKADDRRLARALGIAALVGPATCFLLGLWLRSALVSSRPVPQVSAAREGWVDELLELHNRYRAGEGLPPLAIDDRLGSAAQTHAQDMAVRGVMAHEGGDGSNPADRVERAGYHYASTGENVAMGQSTPEEAVRAWWDSPPHRRNILGQYIQCGAGRSVGADGRIYWCMNFGTPQ